MTQQISEPVTLDLIIRARFATLLKIEGLSFYGAAKKIECSMSTVLRRTVPASDTKNWRAVTLNTIDEMLKKLGIQMDRILQPVLMDGDKALLKQCRHQFTGRLDSSGNPETLITFGDPGTADAMARMEDQGLVVVIGEPGKDHTWVYQLTPLGRRAIR